MPSVTKATRRRNELFRQALALAPPLLAWFAQARRPLPWRQDYAPYAVWISEMMLQQTQVETVLPYYRRWMERFPNVEAVAVAPIAEVLKHWEGLGYYSRARNLHRAAQALVEQHGGRFPDTVEGLMALPGIGRYTAGAIASIGFNRPVPIVDGNVARVLSRLFAIDAPPRSPEGQRLLWEIAAAALPADHPRAFNEAMMELGALVCRPRSPQCLLCPLNGLCRARERGDPEAFPVREPRKARPVRHGVLLMAQRAEKLLVRQRPAGGLWGGLWEFPWREREEGPPENALKLLTEELGLRQLTARPCGTVSHGLTHFQLELNCFRAELRTAPPKAGDSALRWVTRAELAGLALGRPNHKALELLEGT